MSLSLQVGMPPPWGLLREIEAAFVAEGVGSALVAGVVFGFGAPDTELDLAEMSLESVIDEDMNYVGLTEPQAATEEARACDRMNIDFMVTVAVDGLSRS